MATTQLTPEAKPAAEKTVRAWYRRWWFRTLTGLVVFFVLLFLALPFAAKYSLKRWLEKNGADQAQIDAISYNPFHSRVSLRGLAAGHGGQTLLSNGVFTIDLGLGRLFSRDIHIEEASYHDLLLDIEQKPDGSWRFGTYSLAPGEQKKEDDSQKSEWIFSARNISLANCQIHFKTPDIDLTLLVSEARLSNFSTSAAAAPATLTLRGTLNGQTVDIQLDALTIAPSLALNGRVKIDAFDLAIVKKYVEKALPAFAGKVSIEGKGAFALKEGGMQADYDGVIAVAQPLVGNKTFNTAATTLSWNGAVSYHAAADDSGVTTKGTLAASGLTATVPDAGFSLKHEQFTLSGDCVVPIAPTLSVRHEGTLTTGGTVVNVQKMKIWQKRFNWQGKTQWTMPGGVSRTQFNGALASSGTRYEGSGMQAGVEDTTVAELTGDIGKKITIKSAAARGLSFAMAAAGGKKPTASTSLSVATVSIGAAATDNFIDWQTQRIGVRNVDAKLPGPMPLALSLASLDIDQITSAKAAVWKTGSLSMRQFAARSPRQKNPLAALGAGKISDIKASKQGEVEVGSVELSDMHVLGAGKKDAIGAFDRLVLRHFAFSPTKGLAAASVRLNGLAANLARDEKGTFNVLAALAALTDDKTTKKPAPTVAEAGTKEKKAEKALPIRIHIQETALDGHIVYSDKSLPMPFAVDAAIETFSVKNIDSANPDQKSAVELAAQLVGRAPFNVKGDVAVFASKPNIALDIHLKNYPLSNLSPYTAMAVGTALASGELKLDATVSLENDYLKVANKVFLQKLETKTLSPELAAQLNNQLPMPLDAALALLRDSNRNITLDIPVEGELSSLHVGLTSIIITALGKAIIPAASAYLVYALGPYGALAYVGMKVGQKMMQVTLPPVEFEPGKADLSLLKDDYLQRVGKVLADRPETDLQLVPQVVADELSPPAKAGKGQTTAPPPSPELTKKLEDLGQRRAQALRQRLHDQAGVDMNRLMISETQIVPDGKPQVLLGL